MQQQTPSPAMPTIMSTMMNGIKPPASIPPPPAAAAPVHTPKSTQIKFILSSISLKLYF
jgi:hypothetical protein